MVLPRPTFLRGGFRPSTARFSGSRVKSCKWRQAGRRSYASEHGPVKPSSDLPWLIGSTVVTVPSAIWLWQQGPKKGGADHGHDEHGEHEEHTEVGGQGEEKAEGAEEESKQEDSEGSKEEGEERSGEGEDKPKDEGEKDEDNAKSDDSNSEGGGDKDTPPTSDDESDKDEDGYEKPSPNAPGQINKNDKKGPGEQQKDEGRVAEKQEERGSQKDHSGAKNPYIDDPEKSKKGEGVTDTAKIHGTVDPKRPSR